MTRYVTVLESFLLRDMNTVVTRNGPDSFFEVITQPVILTNISSAGTPHRRVVAVSIDSTAGHCTLPTPGVSRELRNPEP